jgi:hypothetical protein
MSSRKGRARARTLDHEYLEKADQARMQAELAATELEHDAWLRLSRGWLELIRKARRLEKGIRRNARFIETS